MNHNELVVNCCALVHILFGSQNTQTQQFSLLLILKYSNDDTLFKFAVHVARFSTIRTYDRTSYCFGHSEAFGEAVYDFQIAVDCC